MWPEMLTPPAGQQLCRWPERNVLARRAFVMRRESFEMSRSLESVSHCAQVRHYNGYTNYSAKNSEKLKFGCEIIMHGLAAASQAQRAVSTPRKGSCTRTTRTVGGICHIYGALASDAANKF
jgi:hypothetical protein